MFSRRRAVIKRVNTCYHSVIVHNTKEQAMWRVIAWLRVRDTACTPCSVLCVLPVRLLLFLQRTLMLCCSVGRYIWHHHKSVKLKLVTSTLTCDGDREMNGKHLKWAGNIWGNREMTKNIKLLFNSPRTILPNFVEWERAEHDCLISVLEFFVS